MANLEIMPLGGAGEIGRNCTLLIQGDEMVMIDCGISFPDEETPGVDIVIPDFTFVDQNRDKLKALILTHAHEDHVGAIPSLVNDIKVPIYATAFTHAMIRNKLEERTNIQSLILKTVEPGKIIKVGKISFELIPITHSIPHNCGLAIHTDHGAVVFTGDFKLDPAPVDGIKTDVKRLKELGEEGVVCLFSDSTNIDRPGYGPSESSATAGFREAFKDVEGRILITMFASNIHRMQQVMNVAEEFGRKVAVAGRRMEQTIEICTKMGILSPPKGIRIRLDQVNEFPPEQVVILLTGSQGEPRSALVQMSKGTYGRLKVREGDTILYSARPIPGNEAPIWRTINRLFSMGADVVFNPEKPIHISGHAYREELKQMIAMTKPFYLAPVHGEPRHQWHYEQMALEEGHLAHRIFKLKDGQKLVIDDTEARVENFIVADPMWLDSGGNVVEKHVVEDRNMIAESGIVILTIGVEAGGIGKVHIVARGVACDDEVVQKARLAAADALQIIPKSALTDHSMIQGAAIDAARAVLQRRGGIRPMVLATVMDSRLVTTR